MGLFKKIRNAIHKVDPVSKAIDKKLGNVDKKRSPTPSTNTGSTSSRGSAGGTGPQTQDMGKPQRATLGGGSDAMATARNLSAGAKSGVGRMQKAGYKVK